MKQLSETEGAGSSLLGGKQEAVRAVIIGNTLPSEYGGSEEALGLSFGDMFRTSRHTF